MNRRADTSPIPSKPRPEEPSAREAELVDRLIACAAGLPRVCSLKRCRRRKRCLGPDLVCLRHHRGLARARYRSALQRLGWRSGRAEGSPPW